MLGQNLSEFHSTSTPHTQYKKKSHQGLTKFLFFSRTMQYSDHFILPRSLSFEHGHCPNSANNPFLEIQAKAQAEEEMVSWGGRHLVWCISSPSCHQRQFGPVLKTASFSFALSWPCPSQRKYYTFSHQMLIRTGWSADSLRSFQKIYIFLM